eukprot:5188643-Pyramimonas_sp.AAC.1
MPLRGCPPPPRSRRNPGGPAVGVSSFYVTRCARGPGGSGAGNSGAGSPSGPPRVAGTRGCEEWR